MISFLLSQLLPPAMKYFRVLWRLSCRTAFGAISFLKHDTYIFPTSELKPMGIVDLGFFMYAIISQVH